jgi:hypothetical protein
LGGEDRFDSGLRVEKENDEELVVDGNVLCPRGFADANVGKMDPWLEVDGFVVDGFGVGKVDPWPNVNGLEGVEVEAKDEPNVDFPVNDELGTAVSEVDIEVVGSVAVDDVYGFDILLPPPKEKSLLVLPKVSLKSERGPKDNEDREGASRSVRFLTESIVVL